MNLKAITEIISTSHKV